MNSSCGYQNMMISCRWTSGMLILVAVIYLARTHSVYFLAISKSVRFMLQQLVEM
jgi:hypothetical protein